MSNNLLKVLFATILIGTTAIATIAQQPYRTQTFGFDWRTLQVYDIG